MSTIAHAAGLAGALPAARSLPAGGLSQPAAVMPVDALITRCQSGDRMAFRELFRQHRVDVTRIVFRVIGPSSEIDDVVQEVFFQVHRSIQAFRGQSKFTTWLHRVAVNVALQFLRKRKASLPAAITAEVPENPADEAVGPDPLMAALSAERLAAVYRVLETLSDKKRVVFVLHDLQGIAAGEIARTLRIPVLTVRTRLFYARKEFYERVATEPAFGEGWKP